MKTLLYSLLAVGLMLPQFGAAQEEAGELGKIWSYPIVYQYDEEVTWYFDLSGTTFTELEDLYIWIWSPSEPDAGNWENSSDFAKLSYQENGVWSITLIPTEYFSMSAADIAASTGFWLRLKNKDGSKQSGVGQIPYTLFDDFESSSELIRSYPNKPSIDEGLSILFNANLADGFEGAESVHLHSGLNDWEVTQEYQAWLPEISSKTQFKDLGGGIYKIDLIPSEYYGTEEGYIMTTLNFLIVVKDWAASSSDQLLTAAEYIAPPPPEFKFFPLQISQKDFLGMIRTNNERGVTSLKYIIKAADKVITGELKGNMDRIIGFVDLVTALDGMNTLNQIHIKVVDTNDQLVIDTDIPLKR